MRTKTYTAKTKAESLRVQELLISLNTPYTAKGKNGYIIEVNPPRQLLFTCYAAKWFEPSGGNTYHSVRITNNITGDTITSGKTLKYGYGEQYRATALDLMQKAGWLPKGYDKDNQSDYERENDYPITWNVSEGLKRDAVANGIL